ncbi:Fc receptor-like protein 5 [Mixophyes fleayi]|uniref:Fc receptor-like protein 5 n=1 Tax=Mixophyes fleayi TaxID=3061075 RepID=UPI003F4E3D26
MVEFPNALLAITSHVDQLPGAAVRPVVIFSPNYYNIFISESVTMTCNTGPAAEETQTYDWYKDNKPIHRDQQSIEIKRAKKADSGDYQCRTSTGDYSHPVRLDVSYEYLILQKPPSVYEGDPLTLRCHSVLGFPAQNTMLYKDGEVIQSSVADSVLHIAKVDKTVTGTYRCTRQLLHYDDNSYYNYSAVSNISVSDLFSRPEIKMAPNTIYEGDDMTLTCDTTLAPFRNLTGLQFGFHRDGRNVQEFNLSDTYIVPSAQLEDSGNYTCDVRIVTSSERKRSEMFFIQVKVIFGIPQINSSQPSVTEGDDMTLACDPRRYPARSTTELQFAFYRDGRNVQEFNFSDTYRVPSAQLEDSGNYTCDVRTAFSNVRRRSNVLSLQVEDIFVTPQIVNHQSSVTEGDDVALTCDTQRNPIRATTELQFAFYRDGRNVQEFSVSDTYRVPSAQLEDSGNYTCDVRTSTGSVRKRSNVLYIQIEKKVFTVTKPVLVGAIIGSLVVVFLISVLLVWTRRNKSSLSLLLYQAAHPANITGNYDLLYPFHDHVKDLNTHPWICGKKGSID